MIIAYSQTIPYNSQSHTADYCITDAPICQLQLTKEKSEIVSFVCRK